MLTLRAGLFLKRLGVCPGGAWEAAFAIICQAARYWLRSPQPSITPPLAKQSFLPLASQEGDGTAKVVSLVRFITYRPPPPPPVPPMPCGGNPDWLSWSDRNMLHISRCKSQPSVLPGGMSGMWTSPCLAEEIGTNKTTVFVEQSTSLQLRPAVQTKAYHLSGQDPQLTWKYLKGILMGFSFWRPPNNIFDEKG